MGAYHSCYLSAHVGLVSQYCNHILFFLFMYSVPSGTEYVSNFFRLMLPVPFPG